jgi:putative transposase
MPSPLERHYDTRSSHFITCSCYRRRPLLADDRMKNIFLKVLEETRKRYGFCVYGYVLMQEHFHLLISNPEVGDTGKVLQVLKQRVSHRAWKIMNPTLSQKKGKDGAPTSLVEKHPSGPWQFWQRRFYDFNVWSAAKHIEKLKYLHRNPVKRGLVEKPEDWAWSSFQHYATGLDGMVEIESRWTARRREQMGMPLRVGDPRCYAHPVANNGSQGWGTQSKILTYH